MPCSGVDKSLLHRSSLGTWRQGAEIPWAETSGYIPACSGARLQRGQVCCWLSSPVKAIASLPCSFLPSFCGWKLTPSPHGLLRKLLSLSPQVIFHHVALKSWALLGEGGMRPINPILPVEGRLGDLFDEQEGPTDPKVASEHMVAEQLSEERDSEINDNRALRVTS